MMALGMLKALIAFFIFVKLNEGSGSGVFRHVETVATSTYKAAVFQHLDPSNYSKPMQEIMLESVNVYEQQISIAASQGVEVIVFPEYGITGLSTPSTREEIRPFLQVLPSVIPDPQQPWNPCLQPLHDGFNITVLRRLSCSAQANNIVVVANMGTLVQCDASTPNTTCPTDGVYQFNSDVVFSKNGTILTTYHKVNLYFEPVFDRPPYPPDYVATFSTQVATFGLITCFDLLWQYPLITMLEQKGIKQVLMPTAWVDGLPYLTSVQSQEAWAIGLGINLIAANIQKSESGYRGSGIYSGTSGYLNYTYDTSAKSSLIISEIPLIPGQPAPKIKTGASPDFIDYSGIIYDDLSAYSFLQLHTYNESNARGNSTLLTGNISCSVSYGFEKAVDRGDYFIAAYQGKITLGYGQYILAVEVCSMLWCWNPADPVGSCAKPSSQMSSANLTALTIVANFSTDYVYPNIIRDNLQLVDTADWTFSKQTLTTAAGHCSTAATDKQVAAKLTTTETFSDRVLVASLYGRTYDLDKS